MYEIFHHPGITATGVRESLTLDAGYLSRILRGLRRQGLRAFEGLDARSSEQV
jgi:hypothetical protein